MTRSTADRGSHDAPVDVWAREVEKQKTDGERFLLLTSVAGSSTVAPTHDERFPDDVTMCTSYTPGVPRLLESLISNAGTPWASSTSSFNPELARSGGHMIAREARSRGFNGRGPQARGHHLHQRVGGPITYMETDPRESTRGPSRRIHRRGDVEFWSALRTGAGWSGVRVSQSRHSLGRSRFRIDLLTATRRVP
jgi:hypothetical protein